MPHVLARTPYSADHPRQETLSCLRCGARVSWAYDAASPGWGRSRREFLTRYRDFEAETCPVTTPC